MNYRKWRLYCQLEGPEKIKNRGRSRKKGQKDLTLYLYFLPYLPELQPLVEVIVVIGVGSLFTILGEADHLDSVIVIAGLVANFLCLSFLSQESKLVMTQV